MHNDRMIRPAAPLVRRTRLRPLALALSAALLLASCAGESDEPEADPGESTSATTGSEESSPSASSPASTASTAEEPYLPVPGGVELTAQGSELGLGDEATVAYEPRQDEVAALDLRVTRIEKASFKLFVGWKLSKETLDTTPYFVHAKVGNVGKVDLGEERVPLYAVDGENRLIEYSTFESVFKPCPSTLLPAKFGKGEKTSTCLVFLAPDKGEVTAASFRPTEDFSPIVWTGEVTRPEALQKDKGGTKGKGTKGKNKKQDKRS